jgi:hypothetical protein
VVKYDHPVETSFKLPEAEEKKNVKKKHKS